MQYFYHPDHLGSASFVTNAEGAVREHIHSHPNRKTSYYGPSGFHPEDKNSGDREFGEWINKYYPNKGIKLKIYEVPIKKYIEYNHKGIVK